MSFTDGLENIEQSQESAELPHVRTERELAEAQHLADQLIAKLQGIPDGDMVGQILNNALKLLRDQTNRGDIKLINNSFKELRYALKIFAPYRDVHKVSIFGSARTPENHPDYQQALEFGRKMAAEGWMVITGAGGGIMAAGHGGAGADPSFGLAIRLPFEQATNPHIAGDPKLIHFKYFMRKLAFVRFSHAIALFPGGFGTMDEGFEVLTLVQTGKSVPTPIVLIDSPGGDYWKQWQDYVERQLIGGGLAGEDDKRLYKITSNIDEAVEEIRKFYSNYHSIRFSRDEMIMRLHHAPNESQLREIQKQFGDLCLNGGKFRVSGPLDVESDEPALAKLARLIFPFNRKDHGRLRILIDKLNEMKP